jgi:hypothetical protein
MMTTHEITDRPAWLRRLQLLDREKHDAPERSGPRSRLLHASARRAATSLGGLIALALLPKCPLCIAAYLTAFGLSASIAALLAPLLRPAAALVLVAALLACLFVLWRHRRAATTCEAPHDDRSAMSVAYCREPPEPAAKRY